MYFEYNLRFDEGSWEMITKVETRATTFFLLIEFEFRKYEKFDWIHPFSISYFLTWYILSLLKDQWMKNKKSIAEKLQKLIFYRNSIRKFGITPIFHTIGKNIVKDSKY